MNFLHLKAFCEIVERDLHLSNAAQSLHRSQPALTRQIQQLEHSLGVTLFERNRNRIIRLTEQGEAVHRIALRIMLETRDIGRVVEEAEAGDRGELTVATTHTQARYTLPPIIRSFMADYGKVTLSLRQGTPVQCCDMVASGQADLGICTETGPRNDVVQLPCYQLRRIIVVPARHPLLRARPPTLDAIARYPIITYAEGFSGRSVVDRTFREAGLQPNVILSAIDADVSKSYVEMGMGIAILAAVAFEEKRDRGLRRIDAHHLFAPSRLNVVLRPHAYLRSFTTAFVRMFAPGVPLDEIERLVSSGEPASPPKRQLPEL